MIWLLPSTSLLVLYNTLNTLWYTVTVVDGLFVIHNSEKYIFVRTLPVRMKRETSNSQPPPPTMLPALDKENSVKELGLLKKLDALSNSAVF
jgi:hypothetical protein